MNEEVTQYIQKLPAWQVEVCEALRNLIQETIPTVEERLQYGKPHYLKKTSQRPNVAFSTHVGGLAHRPRAVR